MHSVISCPNCQARLHLAADLTPRRFRCGACGFEFATSDDEPKALDTVAVEELRIQLAETPALIAPRANLKAKPVAGAGCFLQMLALAPLSIAAFGVPFCRFGTGWTAGVFWSVFGIGLALACIALVRRTRWSWATRLLMTLGLTGAGHLLLLGALAVSFWQWMHVIDPADWCDFAPPGGRFHISVPGTPIAQAVTEQGLPLDYQIYELQLRRQDVVFAISYGNVPLQEWSQVPLRVRFARSRDGMVARMPGSRVIAEKRITLDCNPGREFHLEIPGKGMVVARVYFVRNRLFVLLIGGSRITPDAEVAAKFLDSFQPEPLDEKQFPPLPLMQQPPDIEEEDIYPGRKILGCEKDYVTRLILSRDGGTVAAGCRDGTIELWDLGSGKRLGTLHIPLDQPRFALSPDGKTLAVESDEAGCDLKLFAAQTQKEIARLVDSRMQKEIAVRGERRAFVGSIVFSPGGRYLASGHYRGNDVQTIRLWDVPARKLVRTISGEKGWSNVMVFTPDGRYLVHAEENGIICWLDALTGAKVKRLSRQPRNGEQTSDVTAMAFTADGQTLAVSYGTTVRLWDVRAGKGRALPLQLGKGPANDISTLDISANGRLLATGTVLNVLRVSETATGKRRWLWIDPGFPVGVWPSAGGLAFTPDGKRLVMGRHNRVEVWELDKMIQATPEELAEPKDRPAIAEPEP